VSFSAVTVGDLELARATMRELNVLAASLRAEAGTTGLPLEEAMLWLEEHDEGPVLLVEPSDGIEAGAPGENTHILRAFVERDVEPAGVILNDPLAVEALRGGRPGEVGEVVLGGKSGATGSEPLLLEVELVSMSDGLFVPESRWCWPTRSRDGLVDMGSCAVVRWGGVFVLLTSRRTPPFDLGQWRSQGVDPEGLFAIGVSTPNTTCAAPRGRRSSSLR
jgi:microcystin degradation protein MlrC